MSRIVDLQTTATDVVLSRIGVLRLLPEVANDELVPDFFWEDDLEVQGNTKRALSEKMSRISLSERTRAWLGTSK